jgi:predicted O-methyltransferase YrrM
MTVATTRLNLLQLVRGLAGLYRKRRLSYWTLSPPQMKAWQVVRRLVSKDRRWFFEGSLAIPGQLWVAERRALYEIMKARKPQVAFEVGTWRGGGSTLFISQALFENGVGVLYTIDIDQSMVEIAKELYSRHYPHLVPHVKFLSGSSIDVYPAILRDLKHADFLFLDGKEDAQQTYEEFLLFDPFLVPGSCIAAHDWFSEKAALVRQHLEQSPDWVVTSVLGPPASLGLAFADRL